jgi:hypothetical protein
MRAMLLIKRLVTALLLSATLFLFFYLGAMVVGGGIAGASAAWAQDTRGFDRGGAVGEKAGLEFAARYGRLALVGSAGAAVIVGAALSFSGIFPWCRRVVPPPLPLHSQL